MNARIRGYAERDVRWPAELTREFQRECGAAGDESGHAARTGEPTRRVSGKGRVDRLASCYEAAGVGFEPTGALALNGFQDHPVRPLRHPAAPTHGSALPR